MKTTLKKCPHCIGKYAAITEQNGPGFYDAAAAPAISRRDRKAICMACSKAEGLADHLGITDPMARVVTEQDKQEAIRLPAGLEGGWGVTHYPTGGLDEYLKGWEAVYGTWPGEQPEEEPE